MPHVVLFGDSIFDNRAYTRHERHVIPPHALLQLSSRATLLVVDGATTNAIPAQVRGWPELRTP